MQGRHDDESLENRKLWHRAACVSERLRMREREKQGVRFQNVVGKSKREKLCSHSLSFKAVVFVFLWLRQLQKEHICGSKHRRSGVTRPRSARTRPRNVDDGGGREGERGEAREEGGRSLSAEKLKVRQHQTV